MSKLHDAALVQEAADGLAAINRFVASRFELADTMERTVGPEAADEIRTVWHGVVSVLNDPLHRAIEAELADLRVIEPVAV